MDEESVFRVINNHEERITELEKARILSCHVCNKPFKVIVDSGYHKVYASDCEHYQNIRVSVG